MHCLNIENIPEESRAPDLTPPPRIFASVWANANDGVDRKKEPKFNLALLEGTFKEKRHQGICP